MAQEIIPAGSFYPAHSARTENRESWDATKEFLLFVVFKWKRLILMLFIAFTFAAAAAMYLKPPVRSATAEILIKADRLPLQISGLAGKAEKGQVVQVMNSEVQLIESRQVLQAVATKLLSAPGKTIPDEELELKINSITNNLFAVPLPDSTIIKVTYFAETNEEAVKVLSLVVDEYIEKQAAIQSGSGKLLKFYEQEKQRAETELRAAENLLNQWQGDNNTVSISQQITSQISILEEGRKALQQTEAQLEATRAKITIMRNQIDAQPERLVMEKDQVTNPLGITLKDKLLAAEVALQDLLQRFTDKHRSVQEKRQQIATLQRELAAAGENIVGREVTGLNPLKQNLKQQLADAQALASSLISQKQIRERQVSDVAVNLAALREKKVTIDDMSRSVDLHKETFMLYGKKLEEGRIATGLGHEQLANLAVIGPPHASSDTDLFKRLVMVFMSAFVGMALGMAIAFGLSFFNNSIRTGSDIEFHLGLPVLAAIPELPPRPLLLNQQ